MQGSWSIIISISCVNKTWKMITYATISTYSEYEIFFSKNWENVFVLGFNVFEKIDIIKYRKLPLSFRDECPITFQIFWFSKKIIIFFYLLSWQISSFIWSKSCSKIRKWLTNLNWVFKRAKINWSYSAISEIERKWGICGSGEIRV